MILTLSVVCIAPSGAFFSLLGKGLGEKWEQISWIFVSDWVLTQLIKIGSEPLSLFSVIISYAFWH